MDAMALARDERADLADFLASLRPEQWDQPSLCAGWRVRDVAAHVISYEEHGGGDLVKRLVAARFRPGRVNDVALADYAARDPHELVQSVGAPRRRAGPRGPGRVDPAGAARLSHAAGGSWLRWLRRLLWNTWLWRRQRAVCVAFLTSTQLVAVAAVTTLVT